MGKQQKLLKQIVLQCNIKHKFFRNADREIRLTGFTLLELIIVTVIIGVLATIGFSNFGVMRENILAREAIAHLKVIQSAEKMVQLEEGDFAACADTVDCNMQLGLDLSNDHWNYMVLYNPAAGDTTFNATAQRLTGTWSSCIYNINGSVLKTSYTGNCAYTE